jgi:hypothetical protein
VYVGVAVAAAWILRRLAAAPLDRHAPSPDDAAAEA